MAMNLSRSHNFAFADLKWGNQRVLRCAKETGNSSGGLLSSETESVQIRRCRVSNVFPASPPPGSFVSPEKPSPLNRGVKNDLNNTNGMLQENQFHEFIPTAVKPSNLRTRQTSFTPPPHDDFENLAAAAAKTSKCKKRSRKPEVEKKDEEPRAKFSICLTREEVTNDFLAMTGNRPARRPKKRSRIVQKQVNTILPGLWLKEITPEDYKVRDIPVSE